MTGAWESSPPRSESAVCGISGQRRIGTSGKSLLTATIATALRWGMPTPAEKKALLFIASVALLGASVRALRAVGTIEKLPQADSRALQNQLAAVDSARRVKAAKGKTAKPRGRHRLPSDTLAEREISSQRETPNGNPRLALPTSKIDVDIATANQLDALPGVGPVLARRIIADREHRGPFGSLANLRRVKWIGPALAARLDSLVTFSGTPRPPSATPMDSSDTWRRRDDRAVGAGALAGWSAYTTRAFRVELVPGNHFHLAASRRRLTAAIAEQLLAPPAS